MNNQELNDIAKDNLARIMGIFPRTDTLLSLILAVNLGLLTVIATNSPSVRLLDSSSLPALIFLMLLIISFYHLYKCAFPRLEGGYISLIYFREIASNSQLQYSQKFREQNKEQYLDDLIEQIWQNSEILKEKFHHLRLAFIFLLISLIFWLPGLIIFVSKNTQSFLSK
jgi:hypothetical protein